MTKEQLQQYRSLVLEVDILQKRIDKLAYAEQEVQHGFVKGSNPDFPFEAKSFHVSGYNIIADSKRRYRVDKLKIMLKKKQDECQEELLKIQEYINKIPDSTTRVIFNMIYIDGLTQEQVSRKIHMDQSRISRRISEQLNI
jgi:hypothetical protein